MVQNQTWSSFYDLMYQFKIICLIGTELIEQKLNGDVWKDMGNT